MAFQYPAMDMLPRSQYFDTPRASSALSGALRCQLDIKIRQVARLTGGVGFDVIVDTVGGNNLQASFQAARVSGHIATTNARTTQELSLMHGHFLQELSRWVDAGRVRPLIDPHRFTLASAPDAHRLLESGTAYGKIVVEVAPDLH